MSEDIPCKKSRIEEHEGEIKSEENPENSTSSNTPNKESSVGVTNLPTANTTSVAIPQPRPKLTFKNPKFSYIEPGGKKFVWKSLKQIVTQEKSLPWPEEVVLYNSLNAPPSLKPAKKYSDISGLEAPYTDPQTKLHYHNAEEFRIIRTLPSDIIQGYLALRGATNIVG
ncbi:INO80 complex subunit C [Lucilia sericata]|uniref:INO80 complex subunit C n=1 Tax=Lucilia sericata TaxID=13632 RepID=UPI0018A84B1E|nr:INO80 complex subunit C [Lucilia sericata]XP_037817131.1 INO80 complex subunit C [Lucilia sericata]